MYTILIYTKPGSRNKTTRHKDRGALQLYIYYIIQRKLNYHANFSGKSLNWRVLATFSQGWGLDSFSGPSVWVPRPSSVLFDQLLDG